MILTKLLLILTFTIKSLYIVEHQEDTNKVLLLLLLLSAPEIFQNEIEKALQGIPGMKNISDDIVHGKSQEEHNKTLRSFSAIEKEGTHT